MTENPDSINQRETDFALFLDALQIATSRIESHYFQLPVAEREDPVYRERVYCYELYHRLREVLPTDYNYRLDGELDKNGHPLIHQTVGPVKPDFLIHQRGRMDKNLAVVEVKPITVQGQGLNKDIRVLRDFILEAEYFRSIYLIYGDNEGIIRQAVDRIQRYTSDLPPGSFYFLHHPKPNTPAEILFIN